MEVMLVVQKLNSPKNESELKLLLDEIYFTSKEALKSNKRPSFKGLLEIITSETVILNAIHKLKSNKGSNTAGADGKVLRSFILEKGYDEIIGEIQDSFNNYKPINIRRVWIPKPGKSEKRPLGIPSIKDRIIQECIKIVIEPILEAQFFKHSYGFRPMREAGMAISRIQNICTKTKYHWVVEGDISKFFDNVNHTILLKRLYGMGIKDRRVLMLIKQMLKAGIMEETLVNELGTPQGGIISPLLANVYLDALDQFIGREWEDKSTKHDYNSQSHRFRALKQSNLKPAYFVRYADDWVLITNSKSDAVKWKNRINKFLSEELKLKLSDEKTLITNVNKRSITFLGIDFKMVTNDGKKYITRTKPNEDALKRKLQKLVKDIRLLRKSATLEDLVNGINKVNAIIRGIINYYQFTTYVYMTLRNYEDAIKYTAYKALKRRLRSTRNDNQTYKWIKAHRTNNLIGVHENYNDNIPAMNYNGLWIGITCLKFCKWTLVPLKNQDETPYSKEGRKLYEKRTNKKPIKVRADELLSSQTSSVIKLKMLKNPNSKYNFEYFLNRAYAFNRDKGKCRVCGNLLTKDIHIHHIDPSRPIGKVNQINNLASMHRYCHYKIHNNCDLFDLDIKVQKKILNFRGKLEIVL